MRRKSIVAALCLSSTALAFRQGAVRTDRLRYEHRTPTARPMKGSTSLDSDESSRTGRRFEPASQQTSYMYKDSRPATTTLSVATLGSLPESAEQVQRFSFPNMNMRSGNFEAVSQVSSAALLITGNTVGSSMFVLPEAVSGVGMAWGSAIFFGLYLYNLVSGLLLADVAINLHESSDCEVPSSFKDFVDTGLKSEAAGTAMAGASLVSNSCFLAFGTVHAGTLLCNTFPGMCLDPMVGAGAFAAMIAMFSVTQTNKGLESIANASVMVLFSSFLSLLLPSVANISDPIGTFLAPGTSSDGFATAAAAAVPLVLSSLTYQNIIPSVAKLLSFDRTKTTIAVAIGSFIPMAMYGAWCFAVLGGGLDSSLSNGAGAAAFTAFSGAALVGSCVAAVMSLAEEYESMITKVVDGNESCPLENKFSVTSVALSMAPPVALALVCAKGGDLTSVLHFNGAFITPLLYGLLPALLFQKVQDSQQDSQNNGVSTQPLLSWSMLPQAVLSAGAVGAIGQEIWQDVNNIIA